jgi:serine/threonine-protein kinase HSL1 (negative regulator of Swe1 kinase)
MPTSTHSRSQSAYSILNNEHLYSKHSFYESPVSEASYDPFRASRQLIVPDQGLINQNVTVHRGQSNASAGRKLRPATALGHHRTGSSLRVQALRNNSKRSSAMSRGSSNRSAPSCHSMSTKRRSMSRSSLASSHWASSPPVVARSGGLGRRGVSFSHLHRRSSVATASTIDYSAMAYTSDENTPMYRPHTSIGSYGSSDYGSSHRSSTRQPSSALRSKPRSTFRAELPRLKLRKPESPSKYIQTEARKVSTELGKVMEEAFNRSSVGSSIRTAHTEIYHDSPPTSFANTRDSGGSSIATPKTKAALAQRPLPPIPSETPNTFLQRKLAETRAEIARRLDLDDDNTVHFNEVLENLDRLMLPVVNGKRTVSAPTKSPEHPAPLHVIPEEKGDAGDGYDQPYSPHYRAVTDPVRPHAQRAVTELQTIRLVDQSPTRVAPLNIRKRSTASNDSKGATAAPSVPWSGPQDTTIRSHHDVQNDLLAARAVQPTLILEKKDTVIKKKKSLWFRRNTDEKDRDNDNKENQVKQKTSNTAKNSDGSNVSEFPMRHSSAPTTKSDSALRKGFFGIFGKKPKEDKGKRPMELGGEFIPFTNVCTFHTNISLAANFSSSSILSGFDLGPDHGGDAAPRTGPPELQMNWLSRFLHIKPANKTLCFHIGRGKVRQDLVRLLRDWQRFGIRDVNFNRETNTINARVDKSNRKYSPQSCSNFVFSEWRLEDWRFEVECFEVETILRCNAAFFLLI